MRMLLNCFTCQQEGGRPSLSMVEYNDSGIFKLVCPRGHESLIVLQEEKFALLFEIACHAIKDGYYREAVTSFATALERFYEYALRVLMAHRGIDQAVTNEAWAKVKRASERQLGAFVLAWAATHGTVPVTLSDNDARFRNDVVHNGVLPTRQQAVDFGQVVLKIIVALRDTLVATARPACEQMLLAAHMRARAGARDLTVATASAGFLLRGLDEGPTASLEEHLALLPAQDGLARAIDELQRSGAFNS